MQVHKKVNQIWFVGKCNFYCKILNVLVRSLPFVSCTKFWTWRRKIKPFALFWIKSFTIYNDFFKINIILYHGLSVSIQIFWNNLEVFDYTKACPFLPKQQVIIKQQRKGNRRMVFVGKCDNRCATDYTTLSIVWAKPHASLEKYFL